MNEILKNDIVLKIVSILFAIVLWLMVMDNGNPLSTRTFDIPVIVTNDNELANRNLGILRMDQNKKISISVRGRKDRLSNLSSSDFVANVDMGKIQAPGKAQLEIQVRSLVSGVRPQVPSAARFNVEVERIITKEVAVEVKPTFPKDKNAYLAYTVAEYKPEPATVTIRQLSSRVDAVDKIVVNVAVDYTKDKWYSSKTVMAVDAAGKEVASITQDLSIIDVSIAVTKTVEVKPNLQGTMPENYLLEQPVKANPAAIAVTGSAAALQKISSISTQPVNIRDLRQTTTREVGLVLPEGIRRYGDVQNVAVALKVQQVIERSFTFTPEQVKINQTIPNPNYSYSLQPVTVVIKGKKDELDALNIDSLNPSISITDQVPGIYKLPLQLTLPDNLELKKNQEYMVEVQITDSSATGNPPPGTDTSTAA